MISGNLKIFFNDKFNTKMRSINDFDYDKFNLIHLLIWNINNNNFATYTFIKMP